MPVPDEKSLNEKIENLLLYTPSGAEKVISGTKQAEILKDSPFEQEEAKEAQHELKMVKELGALYKESKDSRIPEKVSDFIKVWNESYKVDETFSTSPIDQRYFFDFFEGTRNVWENLNTETKLQAAELATKIITNELAYFLNDVSTKKSSGYSLNFNSYSNMNILGATSILLKSGTDPKLADESLSIVLEGRENLERLGFLDQVKNVRSNGSSSDFHNRDSVHYHIFNQTAWEKTLNLCEELNIEIPQDTREKIESARNFALKFINGQESHLEFVNTKNPNDKKRYADKLGKPFDASKDQYTVKEFLNAIGQEI